MLTFIDFLLYVIRYFNAFYPWLMCQMRTTSD